MPQNCVEPQSGTQSPFQKQNCGDNSQELPERDMKAFYSRPIQLFLIYFFLSKHFFRQCSLFFNTAE